jgi:hypothetical protein
MKERGVATKGALFLIQPWPLSYNLSPYPPAWVIFGGGIQNPGSLCKLTTHLKCPAEFIWNQRGEVNILTQPN